MTSFLFAWAKSTMILGFGVGCMAVFWLLFVFIVWLMDEHTWLGIVVIFLLASLGASRCQS